MSIFHTILTVYDRQDTSVNKQRFSPCVSLVYGCTLPYSSQSVGMSSVAVCRSVCVRGAPHVKPVERSGL